MGRPDHTRLADGKPTGTDWARLAALTDDDIQHATTGDPDAAPLLTWEEMKAQYKPHPARSPR